MENFGPNMVSVLLTLGEWWWYITRAYVPPNDVPAVHKVEQALVVKPKRAETISLGDLNVRLGDPRN